MKPILQIVTLLLLLPPFILFGQDKIGFTIQKLTMNGIEMEADGTVIFNEKLTELAIKQHIQSRSGKTEKNPKYKIKKFKLVGTNRVEVSKGIEISGTAYDENDAHFDFICKLSEEECNLILFMTGIEYQGILIPD